MLTIEKARRYYAEADPVHDFDHILRVLALVERVGKAEAADLEILRAATLLHDASGATPGETARCEHHLASAEIARTVLQEEGWPADRSEAALHCIRAHRFRSTEAPQSLEGRADFPQRNPPLPGGRHLPGADPRRGDPGEPLFA